MSNDPRLMRILRRYPKTEEHCDASVDVSSVPTEHLLRAFRFENDSELASPKQLDADAAAYFASSFGADFDHEIYDYFLHSYVRREFESSYYDDPTATCKPAPESGPHPNIPIAKGMHWVSMRPRDGREHYEAFEDDGEA
jgi:hypothetical protein